MQVRSGDNLLCCSTWRGGDDTETILHDGRCFTLEDTVEYFNLVQQLQLTAQEKQDLVAFLKSL